MVVFSWLATFVLVEIDQRLLGGDPLGREAVRIDLSETRSAVLFVALIVLYEIVPSWLAGATAGKAMFGLRVRREQLGLPAMLVWPVRALVLYAPVVGLGAPGVLWIVVLLVSVVMAPSRRGLHDRLVGTTVVSIPR